MLVVQLWNEAGIECQAWAPRVRRLWSRIGKDYGWKHPRAPSVRSAGAALEFLEDTRVGSWASARG